MPHHHIIDRPPVSQDGLCHYVAASFEANSDDVNIFRTLFRGKPISVIHRAEKMHLVLLLAKPISASDGIGLVSHLVSAVDLPLIACAPASAFAPQWKAPKLTVRDVIRVDLAVGGPLDILTLPVRGHHAPMQSGAFVENRSGTMTYVGRPA